jgi:hypothetical protein
VSDLATRCFTSTGAVGRKREKSRRFALREDRRLGRLPAPSALAKRAELLEQGRPVEAAAA